MIAPVIAIAVLIVLAGWAEAVAMQLTIRQIASKRDATDRRL